MGWIIFWVKSLHVVGVVSSWAFWYLQINIKPKIDISPHAVYDPTDDTIGILVINRSKRQATDINVLLFIGEVQGNWYETVYTPKLNRKYLFALDGRKTKSSFWQLPTSSYFEAVEGGKIMDILAEKSKKRKMIFTLSATDAISSTKVIYRVAYGYEDIKRGKFKQAGNFDVIPIADTQKRKPRLKRTER